MNVMAVNGTGVGSGWKRPHATDAKTGIPSNRSPSSPALFRLTIPSSHFEMRTFQISDTTRI